MSLTYLLFLSTPAALAAVWAFSAAFESRGLLPDARCEPLPLPVRSRTPRA
jgi:hypothetical protein